MRHFAALIGMLAFLAISGPASDSLFAQNRFQPSQPTNQDYGAQNNSTFGNRTANASSTTSGLNGLNPAMQDDQPAQGPEIFVLKLDEKMLEDLKNGYSLTSAIPMEIRNSVKEIRLQFEPTALEDRTAGLPNNSQDPNRVLPFQNQNPNTGTNGLQNNNRLDSNRSGLIDNRNGSGASFRDQNNLQSNGGSQLFPPLGQRQYDTQVGPPIPNRLNQFNNDPFNRGTTQPINSNQPPSQLTPRNNTQPSTPDYRPFQPRGNSGSLDSSQMRPSTPAGNEYDTTSRRNMQDPNQQNYAQNNRYPNNGGFRSTQSGLQAPRLDPVAPRNSGYVPQNRGTQYSNGQLQQNNNGQNYGDQRIASDGDNRPLDWNQQQYQSLQNRQNDPRYANNNDPRYANNNDPRYANNNDPRYSNNNDPQYANNNDPRYANANTNDPRYAVDPRYSNDANTIDRRENVAQQNIGPYQRNYGSMIAGQDVPRDRDQLAQANNAGYRPYQNQLAQQNNMSASIPGQQPDTETVGVYRGPNHENAPVAQLNKFNQVLWFFLLCSLGLNLYLGWISRGFYVRYRELADELRDTFSTV